MVTPKERVTLKTLLDGTLHFIVHSFIIVPNCGITKKAMLRDLLRDMATITYKENEVIIEPVSSMEYMKEVQDGKTYRG